MKKKGLKKPVKKKIRRTKKIKRGIKSPKGVTKMEFKMTGSNVQATYTEPTENEPDDTGTTTPLTDLGKTTVKFQVQGEPDAQIGGDVPATAATGGGAIDTTIVVPALSKKQATVDFWATSTDQSGNESQPSAKTTLSIDKLAPLPPS